MTTRIDFNISESQPLILLPTLINGKGPFDLVLDTGASMTILSKDLADHLAIRGDEPRPALGAAGKEIMTYIGRADSIAVGGTRVENLRVGIFNELPRCAGKGAIGFNFLASHILRIDFPAKWLALASSADSPDHIFRNGRKIPFRVAAPERPLLLVDALVNGKEPFPFVLDTGASHTIISPTLAHRMAAAAAGVAPLVGAGGTMQSSTGFLESLSLGDASLQDLPVMVADMFTPISQALGTSLDGILGYDFFKGFKLEIDYPGGFLWAGV